MGTLVRVRQFLRTDKPELMTLERKKPKAISNRSHHMKVTWAEAPAAGTEFSNCSSPGCSVSLAPAWAPEGLVNISIVHGTPWHHHASADKTQWMDQQPRRDTLFPPHINLCCIKGSEPNDNVINRHFMKFAEMFVPQLFLKQTLMRGSPMLNKHIIPPRNVFSLS